MSFSQTTTIGTLKVLIADDSIDTQHDIQNLVESMGHSCTAVSDGVAAVAHAKRSHWDLILLVTIQTKLKYHYEYLANC